MRNNNFQNLPSKRLYQFLSKKVEDKELTLQQIADTLEVYQKNPSSYFHALRTGTTSVKIDHILKAQEHFGLDPCDLFKEESESKTEATSPKEGKTIIELTKEYLELLKNQQEAIRIASTTINQQATILGNQHSTIDHQHNTIDFLVRGKGNSPAQAQLST